MSFNDGFSIKGIPVPPTAPVSGNALVYDGTNWVAGTVSGGGGGGDINSVTAGTNLTGGGTSGDVTVSLNTSVTGLTNLQATSITGSFSGNLTGTASFATNTVSASSTVYTREWHVSTGSGDDVTGNGTLLNPYRTLSTAITAASGFGGDQIVLHPGSYFENVTMGKANTTICAAQGSNGGEVNFSGTMTISQSIFPSSSIRLFGIAVNDLIHNGIGSLYVDTCKINNFTKTTNTYCEINDSDINTSLTVNGAGTLQINSGKQTQTGTFTIDNLSAIVSVKNSMNCTAPIVTRGYFAAEGSNIFAKATGYAVSASAFTKVELNNCYLITPVLTRSSASLQGQYSITNVIYNKTGSILGTSLNLTSDFQNIRADSITGSSISYTPADNTHWSGSEPTTLSAAVNRLAARLFTISGSIP